MPLIENVIEIALDAGNILKKHFLGNIQTNYKIDNTPVTIADYELSEFLEKALYQIIPVPVITEENIDKHKVNIFPEKFWLVDPLDGTEQFIKKTHEFCISIALINKGQPILGVIYAPLLDELYYADTEEGFGTNQKIIPIGESMKVLISNREAKIEQKTLFDYLQIDYENLSIIKSALKYGRIAIGEYNFYLRTYGSQKWDIAAGDVILRVTNHAMKDLSLNNVNYTNPFIKNEFFIVIHNYFFNQLPNITELVKENILY